MRTMRPRTTRVFHVCLWFLVGYCCLSMLTLPFLNSLWLGEVPVLAVIQLPKTLPAIWARTGIVMPAIRVLGVSRGSFSPDYILARPYGLLLVYLVPAAAIAGCAFVSTPAPKSGKRLPALVLVLLSIDYVLTLMLAGGPGLTVY